MKKINITVASCNDCPYAVYDSYYSMGHDSGFDCTHSGKRIADDGYISQYERKMREWRESQDTLFPIAAKPKDPMDIPEWCLLEAVP